MERKYVESPAIAPDLRRNNSSHSASLEGGSNGNNELKDLQGLPEERRGPAVELANMTPEEYKAFERKTLRKMDIRIIPWITYANQTVSSRKKWACMLTSGPVCST